MRLLAPTFAPGSSIFSLLRGWEISISMRSFSLLSPGIGRRNGCQALLQAHPSGLPPDGVHGFCRRTVTSIELCHHQQNSLCYPFWSDSFHEGIPRSFNFSENTPSARSATPAKAAIMCLKSGRERLFVLRHQHGKLF